MQWQVLQAANLPLGLPADYQLGQNGLEFLLGNRRIRARLPKSLSIPAFSRVKTGV
jgi:hypothetical protein